MIRSSKDTKIGIAAEDDSHATPNLYLVDISTAPSVLRLESVYQVNEHRLSNKCLLGCRYVVYVS